MSRHWNPDEELVRRLTAEELARAQKQALPDGAVAGLVLVAACCLAVGLTLYQVAGPREVVEKSIGRR
jgi:hypothetical protein